MTLIERSSVAFRLHVLRRFLPQINNSFCPASIPRSGPAGKAVNCFVMYIGSDHPPMLAETYDPHTESLFCREWWGEEGSYSTAVRQISLHDLLDLKISIKHYFGLAELNYDGVFDYWLRCHSGWSTGLINAGRVLTSLKRRWVNRRKLVAHNRQSILIALHNAQLNTLAEARTVEAPRGCTNWQVYVALHGMDAFYRVDRHAELSRIHFYLDSLRQTEEVIAEDGQYFITGIGIRTISDYEEQERKHQEQVILQRQIAFVGLLAALAAAVPAYDKFFS